MSNYTKLTAYDTKDSLTTGDPLKRIKGTELDDEFDAIATAIATKANLASPEFHRNSYSAYGCFWYKYDTSSFNSLC